MAQKTRFHRKSKIIRYTELQKILKEEIMADRREYNMRKFFNYISIFCIGSGLLVALFFLGSNFEFKHSSALAAIFYGAFCSGIFWVLGLFVDKLLKRIHS
jgi:hypothetical protein